MTEIPIETSVDFQRPEGEFVFDPPVDPANPPVRRRYEPKTDWTLPRLNLDGWDPWGYYADPVHVVDGDTFDFEVDLGFGVTRSTIPIRIRLLDIDTHETYGVRHDSEEYALGIREKRWVEEWFLTAVEEYDDDRWPVVLRTVKGNARGSLSRWLADVYRRSDGACLNRDLYDEFGEDILYE